ncbi:DMT family transporter [Candidatus Azambacteria bacterium]|nr:DMT family transporter [Candidatus Azambacteria bacterium]
MNWIIVSVIAQIILGTSAVFDKMLLKKGVFDPLVYTFWLGILDLLALALVPFGFHGIPFLVGMEAFVGGIVFICAMFYLFASLHKSEASKSLLFIGALTPLTTLFAGYVWLETQISIADYIGFFFLVIGGIILFFVEEKHLRLRVGFLALASAIFFAISNVLTKSAFDQASFVTGFFWVKMGGVACALAFLAFPAWRARIFSSSRKKDTQEHHAPYVLNRVYAATGSLLVSVAIFLAHPALVEAMQGLKYVVIFLASWFFLHEHFRGKVLAGKLAAMCAVGAGLTWLAVASYAGNIPVDANRYITWGVTFSQKASRGLGLDWHENFRAITNDLRARNIRLAMYWDETEKTRGTYDFTDTDWLLDESARAHAKITLAIGMKAPRWPECHIPDWARDFTAQERESALLGYLKAIVERYRSNSVIALWQVENEPYLAFGECPHRGEQFLENEIALVKSLDPSRPVLTTDGGEFGRWYKAARQGDMFGTTMYRKVYPRVIGPTFGAIEYPLAPSYFKLKEKIVRRVIGDDTKPFLVIELQGEPWGDKPIQEMSDEEVRENFSPEYFKDVIRYAKETGFSEYYLWGSEWWYWQKIYGDPRYWDIVRNLSSNRLEP